VIETFASFTGSKLQNSSLFKRATPVVSEAGAAFGGGMRDKSKKVSMTPMGANEITIAEGDEEEDEEEG